MRVLTDDLAQLDIWTPADVAAFTGTNIKTALGLVRRLPHLRAGRKYLVARTVVLAEFGLGSDGQAIDSTGVDQ